MISGNSENGIENGEPAALAGRLPHITYEAAWEKAEQMRSEGKMLIAARMYEYCIEYGEDIVRKKSAEQKALGCYLQTKQYTAAKGCIERLLSEEYIITENERRKLELIRGMLGHKGGT